ncbi:MAG: hypothetical protein JNK35_11810 [Phycisphaerae bacterium]|nr:hypothetical protein [Phycisphaerae bacterium]
MNALIARFRALPRAGRWLVVAGLFIAAYFLAIEPVLAATANLNGKADRLAKDIATRAEVRRKVGEASRQVEQLAGLFGQPGLPAAQSERAAALEKRVNAIFREHRVSSQRTVYKDPIAVPGDPPASLVGPRERLERLGVELSFETDTATLMAILRELERAPEIAAVTKLTVKRGGGGVNRRPTDANPLQVSLAAEAWIVAPVATTLPAGSSRTSRSGSTSRDFSGGSNP